MNTYFPYNHFFSNNHSVLVNTNFKPSDKYLLLDRDGVIIEDIHHIVDPSDVVLTPNSSELIDSAIVNGYNVAILTNQSVVARGLSSIDSYINVTKKMFELLSIPHLPHLVLASFWHPSFSSVSSKSNWRKPNIGMFDYLVDNYGMDSSLSLMIGDKLTDLQPAASHNISNLIHIDTPSHPDEKQKVKDWARTSGKRVLFVDSLPSTVSSLLNSY